jgi:hypothetical protein
MVQSEDEETQRKAVVVVVYTIQQTPSQSIDRKFAWKVPGLLEGLPLRYEAMHFCHDSSTWLPVFSVFKFACSLFTRLRVREHIGMPRIGLPVV